MPLVTPHSVAGNDHITNMHMEADDPSITNELSRANSDLTQGTTGATDGFAMRSSRRELLLKRITRVLNLFVHSQLIQC
jgi:hypothetical protein